MLDPINKAMQEELNRLLGELEKLFKADFLNIMGPIGSGIEPILLDIVEELAEDDEKRDCLLVMITTNGGDALTVECVI